MRHVLTGPLMAMLIWMVAAGSALAQDEAESIQKFLGRRNQWSALVGARFVLEGRIGVISGQSLQFERCDLQFRLDSDLPSLPRDTRVAEVSGRLAREGQRIFFEVESLRRRETDVETLRTRRSRIESNKPEAWFALADWAAGRGEFYEDSELKRQAEELREIGLTTKSRRLKVDDVEGLLELARMAADWNLEPSFGWRFIHDACRIELQQARRDPKNDGSAVLGRVIKSLPGANTPLTDDDKSLRESYEKNPAEAYARADRDTRFKLHRALYIEILLSRIERDAKPDGQNGYDIANRITQQIPELEPLAETYRENELTSLKDRLKTLTRDQVVDFAKKLTDRKRVNDAKQVKQDWLRSREAGARAAGPRGLMRLADDYLSLLEDRATAISLYESAWIANPDSPEATQWLEQQGLVRSGSRWVPKTAGGAPTEDRFAQAIQEGQVLVGMNRSQARAAIGARPSSVMRQASKNSVTELWIFRTEGLVISLSKELGGTDAFVIDVSTLPDQVP